MENSGQKIKRHKISRMEVLRRAENSEYISSCKGDLLKFANDNLNRNNISRVHFPVQSLQQKKLWQNINSNKFMSRF